jgi:UDP-N-acetylglucosamine--N-acetylmuramyl-(pentapeptide) pyrophosphoryl-undecaprenol N-acetylglucosamine transferase
MRLPKGVWVGQPGAPRKSPICRRRPSASPAADHRCVCWSSAAVWGRRRSTKWCPRAGLIDAESERPVVVHQAGEKHLAQLQKNYEAAGVQANCVAFIEDMAGAYEWADLVICRAGALTVAELAAAGVASILVPFPHAVDDHQTPTPAFCRWLAAPSCCHR